MTTETRSHDPLPETGRAPVVDEGPPSGQGLVPPEPPGGPTTAPPSVEAAPVRMRAIVAAAALMVLAAVLLLYSFVQLWPPTGLAAGADDAPALRYPLLPIIGALMALLAYVLIRGGLVTTQASSEDVNPYGMAAVAGLVGLFSQQASEK